MRKLIGLLFVLFLISGCVSLDVPSTGSTNFTVQKPAERQVKLRKITHWSIDGAFSIKQRGKAEIANYTWQQYGYQRYRIRIASALNLYNLYIVSRPNKVILWESKDKWWRARTPEGLMRRAVGWSLPLAEMYFWVRGLPAPGSHNPQYDKFGHLQRLQQAGWTIQYDAYVNVGKCDLPRLLELTRGGMHAKIVIKHWRVK